MPFTASDICKIILAIILPPVGVFLERGCGADFFINILLTILGKSFVNSTPAPDHSEAGSSQHSKLSLRVAQQLTNSPSGYIPGIIHALYIILKY
ncbi:hypothetical protein HYE68_008397 [Fusarium pseudograminearum]|nr:hypothetical protein HYE68_008397 [Fusarium pseudograminearum]